MKTNASSHLLPLALTLAAAAFDAPAQNTTFDVVTIHATVPDASPGHPGQFTITRAGGTNYTLLVFYHIGGTASNAVEYAQIPSTVAIPAGSLSTNISIQPKLSSASTGDKTVELKLLPSPLECPAPQCGYEIGSPSNAVVVIHFRTTNSPPYVQLNSPTNGASYVAPADIPLRAFAHDEEDGDNLTVEFFEGTNSLGFGVFVPALCPSPYCPYFALTWSNVPPGHYVLTAKATDTGGASSLSAPVVIQVTEPHPSNAPPVVHITAPKNGTVYIAPVDIRIDATASDVDDNVVRVDFFAGDHFLGGVAGSNSSLYSIVWSNAMPGLYSLRAQAMDDRGATGLSEPIRIAVTGTNVPPTNPPVVTITAPDPIAAEGTNSWRWYTNTSVSAFDAMHSHGGTNTATFLFRRAGPTNTALTVSFAIGGTASNGVDYVAIPNSLTIPAGQRFAPLLIVPIDDTIPECPESVVLRLTPDTASPPPYVVGWPSRAAAVIVDNDSRPPATTLLCNGLFHLCMPGAIGSNYRLECSPDLIHWITVCTNTVTEPGVFYTEPDTQEFPGRFYRVVPLTATPP